MSDNTIPPGVYHDTAPGLDLGHLPDALVAQIALQPVDTPISDPTRLVVALAREVYERRRAAVVGNLGIDWCTVHDGVRNEDESECDGADGDTPCVLHELFYRAEDGES